MKKFTLFVAAIMASAAIFAGEAAKIEMLWKNEALSTINSGDHARDMDYYDGKLYVLNKSEKKVYTLDAATGAVGETPIAFDNFTGYSVCADNAGNLIVTEGGYGMTNCLKASVVIDGTATYLGNTGTTTGRIDYLDVYGDVTSEDGAIVVGASTNTADYVAIWTMKNGALVDPAAPVVHKDVRGNFATNADVCIIDKNTFWTNGAGGMKPMLWTLNDDLSLNDVKTVEVMCADGGISAFAIDSKDYIAIVIKVDEKKVLAIYDVTNPEAAVQVVTATDELTGSSTHKAIETVVEDGVATIYVWCPNGNAYAYKYTPAEEDDTTTAVENTTATVKVQKLIRDGQVLMVRDGKTFNMMGQEIR